jgi:hypothetical protein
MNKVTLKFPNLQLLADCLFTISITGPIIDYVNFTITATLTDKQLAEAVECKAEIISRVVIG